MMKLYFQFQISLCRFSQKLKIRFSVRKTSLDMSILTTYEWESINHPELQEAYFEKLFRKLGVDKNGGMYRPFKTLPEDWLVYQNKLDEAHPRGEYYRLVDQTPNCENYKKLYAWQTGACILCSNESLVWNVGSEPIIGYYCRYCGNKSSFICCDNS